MVYDNKIKNIEAPEASLLNSRINSYKNSMVYSQYMATFGYVNLLIFYEWVND